MGSKGIHISTIVLILVLFSSASACGRTPKESKSESIESDSVETITISKSETALVSGSDTSETTKPEPTGFVGYADETVPENEIDLAKVDMSQFSLGCAESGGYGLGRGNPDLLAFARRFFSNDTLEINDIPYFYNPDESYEGPFNGIQSALDLDYVRYVLEENGLRLWVDEIPYSYFEEKFPEYTDDCRQKKFLDINVQYWDGFFYQADKYGFDGKNLTTVDYTNGEYTDIIKLACFMNLYCYNDFREQIAATIQNNKVGIIQQGLTPDGKYVWCMTEEQHSSFSVRVHKMSKCENVDILIPESREELAASGIDVEKYDEMTEVLFGGAKMSK